MTEDGIDFQLNSNVLLSQSLLEKSRNVKSKMESLEPSTSKLPVEPTTKSVVPLEKEKSPIKKQMCTPQSSKKMFRKRNCFTNKLDIFR